ncbi:MAG TPA: hypothetical protein VGO00_01340, partial [Kofleriaceae bacterium]|nr:hypothetical protein [Kofleriaceae bacterium]
MTVARGTEALVRGDWQAAKDAFGAAGDSPDALAGLGEATFWLGDLAAAVEIRQRAYVGYRDHGDSAAAARMALWLAAEHSGALGNPAVGNGWLARAERLIDELGACVELGWLLLRRSRSSVDPTAAEQLARDALALAHTHHDRDLEIAAISQQGRALLAAGRTAEGFGCLDEAMAAATSGEVSSHATVSDTCCDMIIACERTMAIERATQWCQVTDDYARRINFLPLFAFCRVTYAGVLIAIGRWPDAERELGEALASYRASFGKPVLAVAKLAELRVLQGRDAEAEELVADHEHEPAAARVIAMLHLARGDADRAVHVLTRRLAAVAHDVLLAAPVLVLAVEAHLANGDGAAATAAAERLEIIARTSECQAFAGAASYAVGLAAADADRLEHAITTYA